MNRVFLRGDSGLLSCAPWAAGATVPGISYLKHQTLFQIFMGQSCKVNPEEAPRILHLAGGGHSAVLLDPYTSTHLLCNIRGAQ